MREGKCWRCLRRVRGESINQKLKVLYTPKLMPSSFDDDKGRQHAPVKVEAVIQQHKQVTAAGRTGAGIRLCEQRALQSRLYRKESRTKECLPQTLPSSSSSCTICSHTARRPRRAIMWCQCLGPCATVPSGAEPLRPCCHISPPISSSRSAFSFSLPASPCARPSPCSYLPSALHLCSPTASSLLIFCLDNQAFSHLLLCRSGSRCPRGETCELIIFSR